MNRLYLVTGACGHVGNTLVKQLVANGEKVRGLVLPKEDDAPLAGLPVELVRGDVRDVKSLEPFFDGAGYDEVVCIHTAGIVSIASKFLQSVIDVNVKGTKNIVEMCLSYGVKRLVYTSSVHAIPELPEGEVIREVDHFEAADVVGLYAKSKARATQIVLDSVQRGLDAVIVHPSGIIGPNDYGKGHLTQLVVDYVNGKLGACVKGGYDFVDVRDVADGIVRAVDRGRCGECYILSNRYYSVQELLGQLQQVGNLKKIRCVLPKWFVNMVAPMAELYYKMRRTSPLFTRYSMHTLFSNANFSHEKADRELGYTTRSLKETLRDTVAFLERIGRQNACVCAAGLQTPRACCKLTLNQNHIQKMEGRFCGPLFFSRFACQGAGAVL